jgi:ADP-heptose:LPS heptosyltransferase
MPAYYDAPPTALVIQLARMGDFLQTTPLLAALKANHQLSVLIQPALAPLAYASKLVDSVYLLDPADIHRVLAPENAAVSWPLKSAQIKGHLEFLRSLRIDQVFNINLSQVSTLALKYIRARRIRGWSFQQDKMAGEDWMAFIMNMARQRHLNRIHLSDILASYADPPLPPLRQLAFAVEGEAAAKADELLGAGSGPLLGLQLGANHRLRRWPGGNFVSLARRLTAQGCRLALLGTESEKGLGVKFLQRFDSAAVVNLMGKTDLNTLAAVLARMDLVVSSDTGTLHLATAVGAPCLALFMGPAQVHETGPYGDRQLTLQALRHCAPCLEANPACMGQAPCRYSINPDVVARICLSLISGQNPEQAARHASNDMAAFQGYWDSFGLGYIPLRTSLPLSLEQALSLALREMGRILLRSAYQSRETDLRQELERGYRPPRQECRSQIADLSAQCSRLAAGQIPELSPGLQPLTILFRQPPLRLPQAWQAAAQALNVIMEF